MSVGEPRYLVSLYGLSIDSDREIPGARSTSTLKPDMKVAQVSAASLSGPRSMAGPPTSWFAWTRLPDGSDFLQWRDMFEFRVSPDGRLIEGHAVGDVHPETYAVYLLNQALSFAAIKLGLEPVHATVVQVGEGAVAICGPPDAGKTTLAAALLEDGGRLVTDDLLLVRWRGDVPLAQAGPPRLKLLGDTADRFLSELAEGVPMNPNTSKRIVPLPDAMVSDDEVPLRAIVMLRPARAGRVVLRTSSKRRAFLDLVANTFNPVVDTEERLQVQLGESARLAEAVPCFSLGAPRRWDALDEVARRVKERIA